MVGSGVRAGSGLPALEAESVALVCARQPTDDVAGLPKLMVEGLSQADAPARLYEVLTGPLDPRVRDQIVTETRGNPLALLELVRGLTPAELAGGFGLSGRAPPAGSIEESFRRRVEALPGQTRLLLLVAAADPTGDPVLVGGSRAARDRCRAATPAGGGGLLEFGTWVSFVIRWCLGDLSGRASQRRQDVHGALAAATDPGSILIGARGQARAAAEPTSG